MQPTENFSTPRRALDVEDYIDVLRRHKGWIFGPFLFCLVASVVGAYLWPDTYVSEGIIKVEPQQLPTNLVQGVMTQDMLDQINSMTEQIESRAILTNIMNQYNLYPKEKVRQAPEDILEQMKRDIKIEPLGVPQGGRTVPAFKVSFTYPDRHQAMKVVQDLIGKFIDADQRNVSNRASQLTGFLKDQQENASKELEGIETQLTAYKMQNNGTLPDQKAENYQKLQLIDQNRANVVAAISRLQNDKLNVEGRLNLYKTSAEELAKIKPELAAQQQQQQKSPKLQNAEYQVDNWEKQVRDLSQRYTDSYPEVKAAKAQLEDAKMTRDKIAKEDAEAQKAIVTIPGKPSVNPSAVKEEIQRQTDLQTYNMQIASDDNQIEEYNGQLKTIDQAANRLQALLNGVPQSEKEYEDLVRERDLKKEKYEEMTKSLVKGQVTQEMENRQEGENLQILDPASDPDTPTYPNHGQIVAIGAGLGLVLGFVIAGAREMKDTSLKNLKDVRAYTQMAILGSIPLLENDFVVRRRRRLAWLGWTTACLAAAVLMSGSIAYYVFTTKAQ
jgi:polysaccharide biosynthesis transport protein